MSKDDPFISYGQRLLLYRKTGDRYWLENEDITSEMAGKQFALIRGGKKKVDREDALKRSSMTPRQRAFEDSVRDVEGPRVLRVLPPRDISAVLQEQGLEIYPQKKYVEGKPYCSANLLWLRNQLKKDIEDEHAGSNRYNEHAMKFNNLKLPIWGEALKNMSHDEAEHAEILQIIVDVITEKCGS